MLAVAALYAVRARSLALAGRPVPAWRQVSFACRDAADPRRAGLAACRARLRAGLGPHGPAPAAGRPRRAPDRARAHGAAASAAARHPGPRLAARAEPARGRAAAVARQPLSVARSRPLPGGDLERGGARPRARLLRRLRDRHVDGPPGPAAEARLVRERRPPGLRGRGPVRWRGARQRAALGGVSAVPRLRGGRGCPRDLAARGPGRGGRRDDGRAEPRDHGPVRLALLPRGAAERRAPGAAGPGGGARRAARRGAARRGRWRPARGSGSGSGSPPGRSAPSRRVPGLAARDRFLAWLVTGPAGRFVAFLLDFTVAVVRGAINKLRRR